MQHSFTRSASLAAIQAHDEPYDMIIVGGGATGLGAAVDAASRGHRTLLVEQADFAKGTSSRSTKLVHGGVRYLKQGSVMMVLGALRERGLLKKNAPHLVHELAFVIPTYKWWERSFYSIGMKVYDRLAGKLGFGKSRSLNRKQTLAALPNLDANGLRGGILYYDGQFDDSRLAINLARTAASAGATLVNYMACTGLIKESEKVVGIKTVDALSGDPMQIRGKVVINATGVFVDDLRRQDEPTSQQIVAVSQGVHVVLPRRFLPGDAALMVPKTNDGRVLFALPWHGQLLVGTTDTPVPEKSNEPRSLPEERDFILEHARQYLAQDPTADDVLSVFAGLRPLVKSDDTSKGTASLSRDHTILVSPTGLLTVTGGKWTTYRKMGQDIVDRAETIGGLSPVKCRTKELAIHGASETSHKEINLQVYGRDAAGIEALIEQQPELAQRLHPSLPYQRAEVLWHVRHEMAMTVEDVLARRTRALLLNAQASIESAPPVAQILADELGHDPQWQSQQVEAYRELAAGYVFSDPQSLRPR